MFGGELRDGRPGVQGHNNKKNKEEERRRDSLQLASFILTLPLPCVSEPLNYHRKRPTMTTTSCCERRWRWKLEKEGQSRPLPPYAVGAISRGTAAGSSWQPFGAYLLARCLRLCVRVFMCVCVCVLISPTKYRNGTQFVQKYEKERKSATLTRNR